MDGTTVYAWNSYFLWRKDSDTETGADANVALTDFECALCPPHKMQKMQ